MANEQQYSIIIFIDNIVYLFYEMIEFMTLSACVISSNYNNFDKLYHLILLFTKCSVYMCKQ